MSLAALELLTPRLTAVRHLGLYTAFHSSRGNRIAHGVFVPIVLVSMLFLQAYLRVPSAHPLASLFHVGTALTLGLSVVLGTIDAAGSLCLLAFLLPWCAIAGHTAAVAPAILVVPAAIVVHLVAWYGTVGVGHGKLEPWLVAGPRVEDSNLYFRRGYYVGNDLGVEVRGIDRLVQFCVAPLAVVQDALLGLGLRRDLQRAIEIERWRVRARIAKGETPLAARGVAPARSVPSAIAC